MSEPAADPQPPVRLADATLDQVAEAIAAGVHVGLRRLLNDREAIGQLVGHIEQLVDEHDRRG